MQTQKTGLIEELYPICRSITGNGVRRSLRILQELIPLEIREVPSGTQVLEWIVPDEWNIEDAWIANSRGDRVVDFKESNLHIVNYSIPIRRWLSRDELLEHLHSLPEHPVRIPYRTSYYNRTWDFCVSQGQRRSLVEDEYESVSIRHWRPAI